MEDRIKFIALGGLDEPGKDCYVVEINDDIFVIECGISLPDKTIPGVDFLLPNVDYIIQNKDRVVAYIMTHGHDENMGALQYFYDKAPAPIYCSISTKAIMETQTKRFGLKPNWKFEIVNPSESKVIHGHTVHFFQTSHNASYSFGVAIKTTKGNIVYTGDYIIDFSAKEKAYYFDLKYLESISVDPTLLLLAESKASNKPGYCSPKHLVTPLIERYFLYGQKRIFITCFWENLFRINEICELVKKSKRKLFFYNDYTRGVMELLIKNNDSIHLTSNDIIRKEDLLRYPQSSIVILLLGRGVKLYEEMTKLVERTNEDKRIYLTENDIFINCAIPTPTLETLATRSGDNLYRSDCQVVWIKSKDIASMHARQDDLKFFLSSLKPKYFIPIRGSFVNMMASAKLALRMGIGLAHNNVFILDNGMEVDFPENGMPRILTNEENNIDISPVIVDGLGISKTASEVINDRRTLGQDGVVIIACTVSREEGKIVAGPDCQMRGFVFAKEAVPLLKSISQIFIEEVETCLNNNEPSFKNAIANTKERGRRFIRKENGREPLIIPIIIPIN